MPETRDITSTAASAPPENARDNLRDVATFLFGDEWREGTARALDTDRRGFVREFASDEPIRPEIWLALSKIAEKQLERVWQEHAGVLELIREHLHGGETAAGKRPGKSRRPDCSVRAVKSAG